MANQVTGTINSFMKKRIQLQRIAQLLFNAGLGVPLPNINQLLPISQITPQFYNQLKASCPMLPLPSTAALGLNDLKKQVDDAYAFLQQYLQYHPFQQMGQLQDQLNDLLGAVNSLFGSVGGASSILGCLNGICTAGSQIGIYTQDFNTNVRNDFQKIVNQYGDAFGAVLTAPMQQATDQVDALQSSLGVKRTA